MHFIKYLTIFVIKFSLQDVSLEEDSNQIVVSSQEENNLSEKQNVAQRKKIFLYNQKDKVSEKTKELKSRHIS